MREMEVEELYAPVRSSRCPPACSRMMTYVNVHVQARDGAGGA
jgi:hypothetical protein